MKHRRNFILGSLVLILVLGLAIFDLHVHLSQPSSLDVKNPGLATYYKNSRGANRSGTTQTVLPAAPPKPALSSKLPSQILNLTNWKLTVPVDTDHSGAADEIKQPALTTFTNAAYFRANDIGDGVLFEANAGGATTKGSRYPRSELREMTNAGRNEASWANTAGTHTMIVKEAITHLPAVKPEVVSAQIHDSSRYVILIRLEGRHLFVESNGGNIGDLSNSYSLGTTFTVRIVADAGHIKVFYNDILKTDYAKSGSGYYFKAGCYTQSNIAQGAAADDYGQVAIYALSVTHL